MTPEMVDLVYKSLLAFVIMGIVAALKQAGLPNQYAAIVSILTGALVGFMIGVSSPLSPLPIALHVLIGTAIGAGATGAYAMFTKRASDH